MKPEHDSMNLPKFEGLHVELILGRSVLGLQMSKFWQIIELQPLIDVRNFTLYLWHSFADFLQTWYRGTDKPIFGVFKQLNW